MSLAAADKSKPYFPLAGLANDGFSNQDEPTHSPGLGESFICHCTDCHKITHPCLPPASWLPTPTCATARRGQPLRIQPGVHRRHAQHHRHSLLQDVRHAHVPRQHGVPGMHITRVGTVEDFNLQETILKPKAEQFVKYRMVWLSGGEGVQQVQGLHYGTA
ncbi:hypothetical protein B0H17DRAFT_1129315 [Mycena rosella]|uniref:CENP-V/GFA domain-containing protein n=1 Tax=Mycena rosella TaxID=1033263 RepID=A0AAD7GPJ1_MYCRO|nr:hypothetical protein B0H17DRAFT_1129315 [Mycena rosella]